ncbi:MAG TPA: hypothetical protein VGY54_14965, partial [Polyangiaceae bacterium]|nr:hypothetical protein [Polyangiaceae bacterium]
MASPSSGSRTLNRLAFVGLVVSGCVRTGATSSTQGGTLRVPGVAALADPTVRGARIVPEAVDDKDVMGAESGGAVRALIAGLRVLAMPNGAVVATGDQLPQTPSLPVREYATALPDRVGGGFLFVVGSVVWRADRWLAPARPLLQLPSPIAKMSEGGVTVGLDRVYLRGAGANGGYYQAIDAKTGTRLDLGPWPASSFIGRFAASDGWRAVAATDLRGVVATFDAGTTWRPLALPIDPKKLAVVHGDAPHGGVAGASALGWDGDGTAIVVSGNDAAHRAACFEVRNDGQVTKLPTCPTESVDHISLPTAGARSFGDHPLRAAIED